MEVSAVVLAAGKGTRMKSGRAKVLHELAGRPLLLWPLEAARGAGTSRIALVLGHQAEEVERLVQGNADVHVCLQREQLGTGHAVRCATEFLRQAEGEVLILCGDVPLLRPQTLRELLEEHRSTGAVVTVLTAEAENPFGYGRIVRDADRVVGIVEEKDATPEQRRLTEINSGTYCVEAGFLREALELLSDDNAQREYYLTDIVTIAAARGLRCGGVRASSLTEVMGVNDRVQLAEAAAAARRRINEEHMLAGVSIVDPAATYVDPGVLIGADTVIHPGTVIRGKTVIGQGCEIGPAAVIENCTIGSGCRIKSGTVMEESLLHEEVSVGPMAHLRPGSELRRGVKIGNFVETKKVVMGEGSKASHLTYLGDAEIGREVNIGCGTITCN
ncbi:MAG TPA: bifunctional UDP-N-acetylglucosamine diphosphorylase/glucosamine-1-phosphate N-acetyltransferase GlmU, partial [Verrucomicrobiae bacterium]|nr:bifunctional UDP-N-acetylglucosamine diphosphorylase/glucosamine-1-phosphate N-acetyltransferase GlmU [Verrucomicrobiae bacterium]